MIEELPEGWTTVSFGQVLSELRNGISTRPAIHPPGTPILRISAARPGVVDLRDCRFLQNVGDLHATYALRDGDLLFTRYNGSIDLLGVCGMVRGLGDSVLLYPDKLMRVRLDARLVVAEYVELFFQSSAARRAIISVAKSSAGQQGISGSDLKQQQLPLPPLAEQRRIVATVEELLAEEQSTRDHLSKSLSILKRCRQAVLAAACSGKLTEDWREANPPSEDGLGRRLEASRGPEIHSSAEVIDDELPDWWHRALLGDLVDVATGATPHRKNGRYYVGGTVPWVKSGAANRGLIMEADELITELAIRETNAKVFPAGTLVIAMYGEGATRGKVAELGIPAATNQALAALLFDENSVVLRPFLRIALESAYERHRGISAGGVQPNLSLGAVRNMIVDLPPLSEQREICTRVSGLLSELSTVAQKVNSAAAAVSLVRRAILQKAFRGELVPTEAELARAEGRNYETADQLLARVRGEHEHRGSERANGAEEVARKELSLLTLERNDVASALALRLNSLGKGTWRSEYDSVLLRLQDDPSALLAALASDRCRDDEDAEASSGAARHKTGRGTPRPPAPFEELDQDARHAAVFAALWPRGPLEKDLAVRAVAEHLRDAGAVSYQRLRADGPLYATVREAIESSVKAGVLDRPRRGYVRATKNAQDMNADDWRHALVASLDDDPVEREDAIRRAAEWARTNLGVEFERLRADGHIASRLRSAINSAIRRGEVVRHGATRIVRAAAAPRLEPIDQLCIPRDVDGDRPILVLQFDAQGDERQIHYLALMTIATALSTTSDARKATDWIFYIALDRPHVEGLTTWLGVGSGVPAQVVDLLQKRLEAAGHRVRREYAVPARHGLTPLLVATGGHVEVATTLDDDTIREHFDDAALWRRSLKLHTGVGKAAQLNELLLGSDGDRSE